MTFMTLENIDRGEKIVQDKQNISIRNMAHQLDINIGYVHTILMKDLKFIPYNIQLVQQLQPQDNKKRKKYLLSLRKHETYASYIEQLITSDEADSNLNGFVKKLSGIGQKPIRKLDTPCLFI